jgi:methionyl-tRNA formyltransferase
MNEIIDNGKILEVRRFPVTPHDNLPTVFFQYTQ